MQLNPGLPDRQTAGGQNWQQHILPADPQHWGPTGLCSLLYMHDCVATNSSNVIITFSTTVVDLITNDDESAYREEVRTLTNWCHKNIFSLNISKTKELVVDFRRRTPVCTPSSLSLLPRVTEEIWPELKNPQLVALWRAS